jgi:CMP/dCMP kinase
VADRSVSPTPKPSGPGALDGSSLVIAIDGPSGSGKSTVARRVALALGLRYLDTGAMYRALTWWLLDMGVQLADTDKVAQLAPALPLQMGMNPAAPTVHVRGTDVGSVIRETRISEAVSVVAANLAVRADMRQRQRAVVETGDVVVEGRDITTVIAPDAPVRVLLTASEEARLARRAREVHGVADEPALARTRDQVLRRDADDARVSQFLDAAEGVVVVDSSHLTLDGTVSAVLDVVRDRTGVTPS